MSLLTVFNQVKSGEVIEFRPRGNSMTGLVNDGDLVKVVPLNNVNALAVGDVVLVKVKGGVFLHKVLENQTKIERVKIGNNKGGVNGYTAYRNVAGVAVEVSGKPRNVSHLDVVVD